jgi:hypothetical protein
MAPPHLIAPATQVGACLWLLCFQFFVAEQIARLGWTGHYSMRGITSATWAQCVAARPVLFIAALGNERIVCAAGISDFYFGAVLDCCCRLRSSKAAIPLARFAPAS